MDASAFSVVTTAHYDRLLKKLAPKHSELMERFEEAIGILSLDPMYMFPCSNAHFLFPDGKERYLREAGISAVSIPILHQVAF
jgi:hypothetical protein